ncbi:MAG: GvpL/GvpF family gas vesicle protein [Thermodesulfobacteriota bacterium]
MQRALYLFCLARAGLVPEGRVAGLTDDSPLKVADFSGVAAVVCEVPLEDFSGPSAEARLQDLTWIGPRAVRHDWVIDFVMQHSPVFPARFGTLFSSGERLERMVKENAFSIHTFLDRVTNKDEWAVKGLAEREKAREALFLDRLARQSEVLDSLTPGVRYFKERQIRAEVDKDLNGRLKEQIRSVAARLTECSADCRTREVVLATQQSGERDTMVNWAFLVERRNVEDLQTRLCLANDECNSRGLFFELSGPWPPYSFAPALETEPGK